MHFLFREFRTSQSIDLKVAWLARQATAENDSEELGAEKEGNYTPRFMGAAMVPHNLV
jgi:hypothetical protein